MTFVDTPVNFGEWIDLASEADHLASIAATEPTQHRREAAHRRQDAEHDRARVRPSGDPAEDRWRRFMAEHGNAADRAAFTD